jgi:hypothetical protein
MRARWALAPLLALGVAACGTTVPLTRQVAEGPAAAGLGRSETGSGQPTAGGLAGGATLPGSAGQGVAGPANSGSAGTDGDGSPRTDGTTAPLVTGRGVTATTITIGIVLPTGAEALASAFGINAATSVNPEVAVEALVKDVNAHGGVAGRRLTVYVHHYDAASYVSNPAQTIAEICADFRDDHKVFAVAFDLVNADVRACLARMGSPLLVGGISAVMPSAAYQAYGGSYLFGTVSITAERLAALLVASLWERGFFGRWNTTTGEAGGVAPAKIGVIHPDSVDSNVLYASIGKELAGHGLRISDTVTYSPNVQAGLAASQSAVLKFRSEGVTHVFGASTWFLQYAESQGYRPRYVFQPGLGQLGVDNSPANQMRGAMTVGWAPTADVRAEDAPKQTPTESRCRAVMRKAGQTGSSQNDLRTMYTLCDVFYAFQAALPAGHAPTVGGLRLGYEALGSFSTALTFGARFGPLRHAGVDAVRDMSYLADCGCLRYVSRTNRS